MSPKQAKTVTIASGTSLSPAVALGAQSILAIVIPAGWDAADLTFQASVDGVTYFNLHEAANDTEVTVQAGASRFIRLDPNLFGGLPFVKLRSGTAGVPVNQTAARTLTLLTRAFK